MSTTLGLTINIKFVIGSTEGKLWKNDPYARALTQSNGNSVVADANFVIDHLKSSFSEPSPV